MLMLKWIVAAAGVVVISLSISALRIHLSDVRARRPFDAAANEANRKVDLGYERVPLVRLLAAPERYDGRRVQVSGFVTLDFEGSALHLDRAAYEAGLRDNALWIERPTWLRSKEEIQRLNHRYGEVAGTFRASEHGHLGLYSAALTELARVRPISGRSDFETIRQIWRQNALLEEVLSGWLLTLAGWFGLWALWMLTRQKARR